MTTRPASLRDRLQGLVFLSFRIFVAPRSADERERQREYILNVALLAIVGVAVATGIADPAGVGMIALCAGAIALGVLGLSRKGYVQAAIHLLLAASAAGLTFASLQGGVGLEAGLGYALVVICAGILTDTRFAFTFTFMIAAFVVGLSLWQPGAPAAASAVFFDATLFALATVSWLANRELTRSLRWGKALEEMLREERDLLEAKVEERTRELQQAQFQKIEQLNRFAELGKLASGLFHDLINILSALSMNRDMPSPTPATAAEELQEMQALGRKIEKFAHAMRRQLQGEARTEWFDVEETIEEVVQLLAYKARRAGVQMQVASVPATHYGNPVKLHQALMNLVSNAIESFEGAHIGRKPLVRVDSRVIDGRLVIHVEDNGPGIPADLQARIFDPFFTTKRRGCNPGIGIGLASARRITIEELGGSLEIERTDGDGSLFRIEFPLHRPAADEGKV